MVIPRDRFFYPSFTQIMDSFSCSPLNTAFYIEKRLPEVPKYAERQNDMITSLDHINNVTW